MRLDRHRLLRRKRLQRMREVRRLRGALSVRQVFEERLAGVGDSFLFVAERAKRGLLVARCPSSDWIADSEIRELLHVDLSLAQAVRLVAA